MNTLSKSEMKQIEGGGVNWGIVAAIGSAASFIIGVIDGWIHPKRCY